MFDDMFAAYDAKKAPMETFYDGYVVNAIMDAAYASMQTKRWEAVQLTDCRGATDVPHVSVRRDYDAEYYLIKEELMPDGSTKVIVRHKQTGALEQRVQR
jgi:hypothetical protein